MTNHELDLRILKEILGKLPEDTLRSIMESYGSDPACRKRLQEIMDDVPGTESHSGGTIRERWESSKTQHKNRFNELIEKYLDAYLRGERKTDYTPSRAYLENLVSNHSKWNRMINHHGQGRQYRDDIRRVCFVFRLTLPEANELMWSAGQLFDPGDLRDFVLLDCLQKNTYSPEAVDKLLRENGVPELFPAD